MFLPNVKYTTCIMFGYAKSNCVLEKIHLIFVVCYRVIGIDNIDIMRYYIYTKIL